jgi:hypothetical protein
MLKIKDATGATVGVLDDDASKPAMVKKIKPTEDVLGEKSEEEKEEEKSEESEGE